MRSVQFATTQAYEDEIRINSGEEVPLMALGANASGSIASFSSLEELDKEIERYDVVVFLALKMMEP
jgi:hypothetical protein